MGARFSLLDNLDEAARAEIIGGASEMSVSAGTAIFHQGEPADACYLVARGRVLLRQLNAAGEQVIHRWAVEGELFGGVAAWSGAAYPLSATANLDTRLYRWPGPGLFALMQAHPALLTHALRYVSRRLIEAQNRLCEQATLSMPARLARRLLALSEGPAPGTRVPIEGLSRRDLAEMCGTTLYSVSRQLRAWQEQGLLVCGRRHIRIIRSEALLRQAGQ
ncbi:Crp/Fnr family transcriptional regulator [Acanthopleuribacter pedis]|uniref:Crp/Fnr family transcriptional regulator n=1 Tax=Acanthopleuribacter pedis TaxID=442870 RepID=A0A8J7QD61_9BACT|nr:Crp/Fnr family transcriptional regulator [Acanthopleuribacter pedis]MBO1317420.1 Crp/Fnr family transcriptional regulator [Acanthopleuribacter pedis]